METASIIIMLIGLGAALYYSYKSLRQPLAFKEPEKVPSLYERYLAEGYALSENIVKKRKVSMEAVIQACDALDEWDQRVYRITKLTLVKG